MKKYFILITFILISNLNLSAQDYFYRLNSGNPIKLNSNLPNSEEENNNPSIYCEGTESINLEDPESGLVLQFYTNIMIDIQQSSVYRPAYGEEDDQEINSGYITCDSIEECYLINDIFTYAIFNLEEHKIMEIFLKNHDHFMELNEVPENIFL